MTRRRWLADQVEADRAYLVGEHALHLSRVLRAQPGQEFDLATSEGVFQAHILSVQEDRVEFQLGAVVPTPPTPNITLAIAIFKFDRMEWAIEKAVELGVSQIIPFIAARSEKYLAQAAAKRVDRWRRLVLQASEQSRRSAQPEVATPIHLEALLQHSAPNRIVLAETEQHVALRDALQKPEFAPGLSGELALAIGPEGGWTPSELQKFAQAGWQSASLGSTILRAETAAIAALAIAMSQLQ